MIEEFTITAFSENQIGLLNRITIIFTRRHVNIESLTVSESAIPGVHKFTIVVKSTRELVQKVTAQIEKLVEVIRAFYYTSDEIVHQEIALYKVPTDALTSSNKIEMLVRKHSARLLEVTAEYTVIEKTGHKVETQLLFDELNQNNIKVLQFTRSGRISITRNVAELLTDYLKEQDLYKYYFN
jgi:acetolactate synthase I/III small subunit